MFLRNWMPWEMFVVPQSRVDKNIWKSKTACNQDRKSDQRKNIELNFRSWVLRLSNSIKHVYAGM